LRTPRILLIDDDPFVTEIVATFLRKGAQYELLEENNSASAAAVARTFRPDLAILDVDMPGKDGREVANEFRNDPLLKNVTLIFLSGQISASEKGVRNGAVYLPKPFSLGGLKQVLEIVFAGRRAAAGKSKDKLALAALCAEQSSVDPSDTNPWQSAASSGRLVPRERAAHPSSSIL
jgi:DNA-binding response OmpR family regulator